MKIEINELKDIIRTRMAQEPPTNCPGNCLVNYDVEDAVLRWVLQNIKLIESRQR